MFGLFITLGGATQKIGEDFIRKCWPSPSHGEIQSPLPGLTIAHFTPPNLSGQPGFALSDDGQLLVCIDGYVIMDNPPSTDGHKGHVKNLANRLRQKGIPAGLEEIASGSYIITAVELDKKLVHIILDPVGSLPLYRSKIDGGWLISTNPVAIARTGLVDLTIDETACAEWTLVAYTIGERYLVKGIKTFIPGGYFRWDANNSKESIGQAFTAWKTPLFERTPSADEVAEAFRRSCRRIESIEPRPAHLQSAGYDSRLILATWPSAIHPPCYTYGDPEAHEVELARKIAATRGSAWKHVWSHGDHVAGELETMFAGGGIIKWPDRYLAGRRMAEDGYNGLLDGLLAGDLLGGRFYNIEAYFGRWKGLWRHACILIDQKMSDFSLDHIAEAMLDNILEVRNLNWLADYISKDYIEIVRRERENVMADFRADFEKARHDSDSLALGWRNFLMLNRIPHMIIQEGNQCRQSVNVYLPYSNDRDFFRILMSLPPARVRYHRLYRKIYRRHYPQYMSIPYAGSLLPINRPAVQHKLSMIMLSKGKSIPFLTGKVTGRQRDPNSWAIWLRESARMRDYVQSCLRRGGIFAEKNGTQYLEDIAAGRKHGGGKLFHMVSIARWKTIGQEVVRG